MFAECGSSDNGLRRRSKIFDFDRLSAGCDLILHCFNHRLSDCFEAFRRVCRQEGWSRVEAVNEIPDGFECVLFLNEDEGTVLPYSTQAFTVMEGSARKVLRNHVDVLIVTRAGAVLRLEKIQSLGYFGETMWQRAFSFMNGSVRRIEVTLRPAHGISFEEVRRVIISCLRRKPELLSQYFATTVGAHAVVELLSQATTCRELFDALGVPDPQDTLDVLS